MVVFGGFRLGETKKFKRSHCAQLTLRSSNDDDGYSGGGDDDGGNDSVVS